MIRIDYTLDDEFKKIYVDTVRSLVTVSEKIVFDILDKEYHKNDKITEEIIEKQDFKINDLVDDLYPKDGDKVRNDEILKNFIMYIIQWKIAELCEEVLKKLLNDRIEKMKVTKIKKKMKVTKIKEKNVSDVTEFLILIIRKMKEYKKNYKYYNSDDGSQNVSDEIFEIWICMPYSVLKKIVKVVDKIRSENIKKYNGEIKSELHLKNKSDKKKYELKSFSSAFEKNAEEKFKHLFDHKDDYLYLKYYNAFKTFLDFYNKFSVEKSIKNKSEKLKLTQKIIDKTGYKVCPYCNIQYTYTREAPEKKNDSEEDDNRKPTVVAQLDHFYPKSEYPMFALCFYNLIPSCSGCNHVKLDRIDPKLVSPYDTAHDLFKKKIFTYKVSDDSYSVSIDFHSESKDLIKPNDEMFNLLGAYKKHEDYAKEIVKKAEVYLDQDFRRLLNAAFSDSGNSNSIKLGNKIEVTEGDIKNCYFGNIVEGDSSKRSLSKLTKDLFDEVESKKNGYKYNRKLNDIFDACGVFDTDEKEGK